MKKSFELLVVITTLLTIYSCKEEQRAVSIIPQVANEVDSLPGTCPNLTKDNNGNLVLSWVRILDTTKSILCYAVSPDGGKSFGKPVVIPASSNVHPHSENLPKVIFKPGGEILAIWGVANPNAHNKYSGLINYSQSFDNGNTWCEAKLLVNDTAGYDQRYADIALLGNGEIAIIWLDNRIKNSKDGSGLYFATTNGRNGFQNEHLVSEPCCECCRTDLFVDSKNNIHILYRGIIQDSIRDMVHAVSSDGGKTFSEPKQINDDHWVINGCPHTGPAMAENTAGLHFAWFTGGGKTGSFYTKTADYGKSFSGYDSISHVGRHPQLASLANGELMIVWDETVTRNNQMNKRIGLQIRTAEGKNLTTGYLTTDTSTSSYPVVSAIDDGSSVVAYCKKRADKNYIVFQRVGLVSKHGQ